jgi:hypothetical protein
VLLALSTGLTGFRLYEERHSISQLARQDAKEEVNRNIQEATFFNSRPLELPALNLEVKIKPKGIHHVVAGAFRVQENADKKVRELRNKGYNATYIGANRYGLHQVTYESFVNPEEALQFLHRIKQTVSSDAWLLSER